jgi:hypothetical protein
MSETTNTRYRRERYRSDPEYRERVLAQQRAARPDENDRRKRRYRYDETYRLKCLERSRRYQASKRGEA